MNRPATRIVLAVACFTAAGCVQHGNNTARDNPAVDTKATLSQTLSTGTSPSTSTAVPGASLKNSSTNNASTQDANKPK